MLLHYTFLLENLFGKSWARLNDLADQVCSSKITWYWKARHRRSRLLCVLITTALPFPAFCSRLCAWLNSGLLDALSHVQETYNSRTRTSTSKVSPQLLKKIFRMHQWTTWNVKEVTCGVEPTEEYYLTVVLLLHSHCSQSCLQPRCAVVFNEKALKAHCTSPADKHS